MESFPKTIQFVNESPEELVERFIQGLRKELEVLKKEYQPKQPTEYLTRNEVKDLLKCDLSTIHNWTVKGKLIAYGLGHRVYYKRSEVESSIIALK